MVPTDPQGGEQGHVDPRPFRQSTWYLIAVAGKAAFARWSTMLTAAEVTPNQYKLLMTLEEAGPTGQGRLAEMMGIDPRNAVSVVEASRAQGLVRRDVDSTDRRRRVLRLTSTGRRLARALGTEGREIEKEFLQPLGPGEQAELRRLLLVLVSSPTS